MGQGISSTFWPKLSQQPHSEEQGRSWLRGIEWIRLMVELNEWSRLYILGHFGTLLIEFSQDRGLVSILDALFSLKNCRRVFSRTILSLRSFLSEGLSMQEPYCLTSQTALALVIDIALPRQQEMLFTRLRHHVCLNQRMIPPTTLSIFANLLLNFSSPTTNEFLSYFLESLLVSWSYCDSKYQTTKQKQPMLSPKAKRSQIFNPVLASFPFFQNLRKQSSFLNLERLESKLRVCHYTKGDEVWSDNEDREFVFVIKGSLTLHLGKEGVCEQHKPVSLGQQEYFGQSMSTDKGVVLKAVAQTNTVVYKLDLIGMYQHLRSVFTFPQLDQKISFVRSLSHFGRMSQLALQKLVETSVNVQLSKNSIIYSQGEKVDCVYVIMKGDFELSKKMSKSRAIYTIDVCTVSTGECLGLQETLMDQQFQQTALCVSSNAQLIKLNKESVKNGLFNYDRSLIKSRQSWRNGRITDFQKVHDMCHQAATIKTQQSSDDLRQTYGQFLQRRTTTKRNNYITNKPKLKRPSSNNLCRTTNSWQFQANDSRQRIGRDTQSQESVRKKSTVGQMFLQQFLNKKQKMHNKIIMRYLRARPPDLVFNPEKEFAVMKSLNVKPSEAVNNRKKTVAIIKARYFKPLLYLQ